jgi:parallel beta-helix repeat protein
MRKSFLMESFYKKTLGCLILAFLLLLPLAKADTYLTDCAVLNTPGETYYLTQDIYYNYYIDTCMDIETSNITLDCQGHIINGDGGWRGIKIYNSNYVVIRNCVLTDWFFGVDLTSSSNSSLQNLTIRTYDDSIRLSSSHFNTLTDITIYSDSTGLVILDSDYTSIFNSTVKSIYYITSREQMYCHSYFENVTGNGGNPIVFFNSTVDIRDWDNNASEIILCGADNSVIDNLKVINPNQFGLDVTASNNVNITNSLFESLVVLRYSEYNTVRNLSSQSLGLIFSNYNTISNSKIQNYDYGIYLSFSNYNTISDSKIQNCNYGIYLRNSANNSIYNNLFNISRFYFYPNIYPNYWNTTRQEGARIYSLGNEIGGNYWTNPEGTGYSDICRDTEGDGFCDSPYVLATNNVDYLAYSKWYGSPTWGAPRWSDNSTFITYGDLSVFNITWDDSPGYSIDTVLFESNFSGTPTNYTMTLIDPYINETERKGVYSFSDTLPAGTFYWKSYAKASDGAWNSTDTWYFTITSPTTTTLPPVHGVPLLSSTLVGVVIGFGIITFMLRTLFDIREPKKLIEYFIVLAVIVLTVISLIALFA